MLTEVLRYLMCPVCESDLYLEQSSLRCNDGHTFDIARHGYASLLTGEPRVGEGDTAEMVAARTKVQRSSVLVPIANAVADALAGSIDVTVQGPVVDIGAGTGWYLARVLDRFEDRLGLACDVSKHALRKAARIHPRVAAIAADTWGRLPVRSDVAPAVLDIFAPRNPAEIARVLSPGGVLVVVAPAPDHLQELVGPLGLLTVPDSKAEQIDERLSDLFETAAREQLTYAVDLDHETLVAVARMGPAAHHQTEQETERRVRALSSPCRVTLSVWISLHKLRAG